MENDLIRRGDAFTQFQKQYIDTQEGTDHVAIRINIGITKCIHAMQDIPAVDAVEIPQTGIGDLSDGYHTFNGLYRQRMILFAALVKAYKDRAWKSYRHEDGELCFGGGWFIVGIDTPEGSYTYHYENKDFDLFDCEELAVGKHWDGHTEDDVTRLLSLAVDAVEVRHGRWMWDGYVYDAPWQCSECREFNDIESNYCPYCGARMDGRREDGDNNA